MRLNFAVSLAIIVASSALVNAAGPALTKNKSFPDTRIKSLCNEIHSEGRVGPLAYDGEYHGLRKSIPIKYLFAPLDADAKRSYKACDLVYANHETDDFSKADSILILEKHTSSDTVVFSSYRFGLDGKLMSAYQSSAKNDAKGKPVKGTLKRVAIDYKSARLKASADAALEFWLSGQYKQYLPKDKVGGAAPESAKKHAATTAR